MRGLIEPESGAINMSEIHAQAIQGVRRVDQREARNAARRWAGVMSPLPQMVISARFIL